MSSTLYLIKTVQLDQEKLLSCCTIDKKARLESFFMCLTTIGRSDDDILFNLLVNEIDNNDVKYTVVSGIGYSSKDDQFIPIEGEM